MLHAVSGREPKRSLKNPGWGMLLLRIRCFDLHSMCCVCAIRIIFLFIFFWLPLYGTFVSHVCLSVFKVRSNCGLLQRMFNICIYLMHCVNDYLWCKISSDLNFVCIVSKFCKNIVQCFEPHVLHVVDRSTFHNCNLEKFYS